MSNPSKTPPKFYGFHTFAEPGCPITLSGGFRDNIRRILHDCAGIEGYSVAGMPIWRTLLVYESKGTVVPLYTIEENVELSDRPYCDYCRCGGATILYRRGSTTWSFRRATSGTARSTSASSTFRLTFFTAGLIHCNGFGHLVCINGVEGGSNFICGREIMDLWDCICSALCVR